MVPSVKQSPVIHRDIENLKLVQAQTFSEKKQPQQARAFIPSLSVMSNQQPQQTPIVAKEKLKRNQGTQQNVLSLAQKVEADMNNSTIQQSQQEIYNRGSIDVTSDALKAELAQQKAIAKQKPKQGFFG